MSLRGEIGRQLRHPTGAAGWVVGKLMRVANARANALAIEAMQLRPDDEVLELGCGPGHGIRLMAAQAPRARIHGIDQSAVMLAQAHSRNREAVRSGRVRLHWRKFEEVPFPSGSMDKILAVNVAYFWHDAETVLDEVRRVLRPDGVLSLYVTDAETMRRWTFIDSETHRFFDRDALIGMLVRGGFPETRIAITEVEVFHGVTGLVAVATPAPSAPRGG